MDEMQRKAFEAGRHGESIPRDRGATTEEIHAYFDGVLEKQEREARELGYGERLTSVDAIEEAADVLTNTDHGTVAEFIARDLSLHILDSGTAFSAIMDIRAEQEKSSFVLETQDMSIIERYRVTAERVD